MNINDEIDIVKKDDVGRIYPRRVRLTAVRQASTGYHVTGRNMQGKTAIEYILPLKPVASLDDLPNDSVGWLVCPPVTTIDY